MIKRNNVSEITNIISYVKGNSNNNRIVLDLEKNLNNIIKINNNNYLLDILKGSEYKELRFNMIENLYIDYIFDVKKAYYFINNLLKIEPVKIEMDSIFIEKQELDKNYNFENTKIEPIILYKSIFCEKLILVDGRHRIEKHLMEGKKYINAYIINYEYINNIALYEIYNKIHEILEELLQRRILRFI
ncbi:hypothetical protein [Clostridium thermobutyricum]|uniref:hypothetical protein n=1 Tax=Clostridium thermobutyricum TaxID=29372 RepID=UPI0029431A98|nr:hypothetical protein [Clostridium thermobutyricum]